MQRKPGSTHQRVKRRLALDVDGQFLLPIRTIDPAERHFLRLSRLENLHERLDNTPGILTRRGLFLNANDLAQLVTIIAKYNENNRDHATVDADYTTVADIFTRNRQDNTCTLKSLRKIGNHQLLHICDPLSLNENSRCILELLLTPAFANKVLNAGLYELTVIDGKKQKAITYFSLLKTILIREDKYGNIVADVVNISPQPIGRGFESKVFKTYGTLKRRYCDDKGIRLELDGNKTVVKIKSEYLGQISEMISRTDHEYRLTADIDIIRQRQPLYGISPSGRYRCYASQRFQPGELLEKMMEEDIECLRKNVPPKLSIRDRYEIIIALFRAVQQQVVEYKMVHNDLTDRNVLCRELHGSYRMIVIDRGFSSRLGEKPKDVAGTPAYITLERFDHRLGEFSDLASTALVASLFLRDARQYKLLALTDKECMQIRMDDNWIIEVQIHSSLNDLPLQFRNGLATILNSCTNINVHERPTFLSCIESLEDEYSLYKMWHLQLNTQQKNAVNEAKIIARKVRAMLCRPHDCRVTLNELIDLVAEAKAHIPAFTEPHALAEFIYILDLECMLTAIDREEIITYMTTIVKNYQLALERYQEVCTDMQLLEQSAINKKPVITSQLFQVNQFKSAHADVHCHLDAIVAETEHILRKCVKIENTIAHLRSKQDAPQEVKTNTHYRGRPCTIL